MNSASQLILIIGVFIAALLLFSLAKKEKTEGLKLFLFWGMVIPIIFVTLYLAGETVIKNQKSVTKGPVHWHADFEIFVCNEPVDLKDPSGLANRIGTPVLHEHGDNRMHIEGVVDKFEDIRLAKFFEVIGGQLTTTLMRAPTNQGELIVQNGMTCPDGRVGSWDVYAYKTTGENIIQEKLIDFPNYVVSPHSPIPPGDCLIFEFGPESKTKTDKICSFYQIAIQKGELMYEK